MSARALFRVMIPLALAAACSVACSGPPSTTFRVEPGQEVLLGVFGDAPTVKISMTGPGTATIDWGHGGNDFEGERLQTMGAGSTSRIVYGMAGNKPAIMRFGNESPSWYRVEAVGKNSVAIGQIDERKP